MAEEPPWREFEIVIKGIHDQLAPGGVVRHNQEVRGRSGSVRQLDVTVTQTIGLAPLLVVIECKKRERPVGIEDVDAFVTKLRDVDASKGVIISTSGFQKGAIGSARENNILLLGYREARDVDWDRLLGTSAWMPFVFQGIEIGECEFKLADGFSIKSVDGPVKLLDREGSVVTTVQELVHRVLDSASQGRKLGRMLIVRGVHDDYLALEGYFELGRITEIQIHAESTARKYYANLQLANGSVLTDPNTEGAVYTQVFSQGFRWRDMVSTQEGVPLTQEELDRISSEPNRNLGPIKTWRLKEYVRLAVTHRPKEQSNANTTG